MLDKLNMCEANTIPALFSVCVPAESVSPAQTTSIDETVPQKKLPEESAPIDNGSENLPTKAKDSITGVPTVNKAKSDVVVNPVAQLATRGPASHGNQNLNTATSLADIAPGNVATAPIVQHARGNNNETSAANAPRAHGNIHPTQRKLVHMPVNGNYRNHPAHPISFVDTLDPENAKPLDSAQLQEIYASLSSSVTALTVTNNLFAYLTALLDSAADYLVGDLSGVTHFWRWHNIDVLISTMPQFARLLVFKHVFARQVCPSFAAYCSCWYTAESHTLLTKCALPHWLLRYDKIYTTNAPCICCLV